METSILELQKMMLVENRHSEFAEISRHDVVCRFTVLSESEGMGTLEVAYRLWIISRYALSKSKSTVYACLPFPSLRGNVKELPKIDKMIERDKKEGDFGGRGGIHKKTNRILPPFSFILGVSYSGILHTLFCIFFSTFSICYASSTSSACCILSPGL